MISFCGASTGNSRDHLATLGAEYAQAATQCNHKRGVVRPFQIDSVSICTGVIHRISSKIQALTITTPDCWSAGSGHAGHFLPVAVQLQLDAPYFPVKVVVVQVGTAPARRLRSVLVVAQADRAVKIEPAVVIAKMSDVEVDLQAGVEPRPQHCAWAGCAACVSSRKMPAVREPQMVCCTSHTKKNPHAPSITTWWKCVLARLAIWSFMGSRRARLSRMAATSTLRETVPDGSGGAASLITVALTDQCCSTAWARCGWVSM
jgi:hypothetical protein